MATGVRSRRGRVLARSGLRSSAPTKWEQLAFEHGHIAGASIVFSDITVEPMQANDIGTATIKRLILNGSFTSLAAGTNSDVQIFLGVAVVTKDAVEAGVLPDPVTDFSHGWYYWTGRNLNMDTDSPKQQNFDVDIRTMRRLRGGYRLVIISQTLGQEVATQLHLFMRTLWTTQT